MSNAQHPLVQEVLGGTNRELKKLAAEGILPIPADQLLALQVELGRGEDPEISALAMRSLGEVEDEKIVELIGEGAGFAVLGHFARNTVGGPVLESVIRRRDIPSDLLVEIAIRLDADLQEILLLRQDAIVDHPEILDSLERNPQLSSYSRRRIGEYREHLLPQARKASDKAAEEGEPEPSYDEVAVAIAAAREVTPKGERDESTGLTDAQIRSLPVPIRTRLARGAQRSLRTFLIRDPNPQVARAVLHGNNLPDSEVEQIASNRTVSKEVLEDIGKKREWVNKYGIVSALVHNPRTPVGIGMRLVPRLSVRDLRNLARDRNVPDAVRSRAQRLYTMKRS